MSREQPTESRAWATNPLTLGTLLRLAGPWWIVKLAVRRIGRIFRQLTAPTQPHAAPAVLQRRAIKTPPRFFVDAENRAQHAALVEKYFPQARERTLALAADALNHRFDLLGSGPVEMGSDIDWTIDYKTGVRWPLDYHLTLEHPREAHDVKVPWELSRCYHFATLGKAYAFTGDERYAQEFVDQITSWRAANPVGFGVNWHGTMEVAIRAVNWLWGYHFLQGAQALTPDFEAAFVEAMDQHGRHIIRNLETWWPPTNHLVADLSGLVYLGVMLPQLRESRRWLRRGINGLAHELATQVFEDGVVDEASTSYHRLVTELSLSAALLASLNEADFPGRALARLQKMLEFIAAYTRPDGYAPAIGDADDGRLHVLSSYTDLTTRVRDHRYLLALGAVFFGRADFAAAADGQWEDALWMFGPKAESAMLDAKPQAAATLQTSRLFPVGGWAFMQAGDRYLSLKASPHGHGGSGGHAHNDTLSITVSAHGKPFLIDPGAYVYTADPAARNHFRASAAHNTLIVDRQEINRFPSGYIFFLADDAPHPTVHHWQSTPEFDRLDVSHSGYERLAGKVTHLRQIVFAKTEGFWLVRDRIQGEGEHTLLWPYHFERLPLKHGENLSVYAQYEDGAGLLLLPLETDGTSMHITEDWLSPRYGVREPAPVAKYTNHAILPAAFTMVVYPYRDSPPYEQAHAAARRVLHILDETP